VFARWETAMNKWLNIISEIGNRYASNNSAYVFGFAPRMPECEDYYFGETTPWSGMMSWHTDDKGVY